VVNRAACRVALRLAVALAAGASLAWTISACGSGGSGTAGQQARQAASTAASQAEGKLGTSTQPAKDTTTNKTTTAQPQKTTTAKETTTVTQPPQSSTVTETRTATAPAQTTSVTNQTTSVQVAPTSTTGGGSGGGVPWWGWLLIALGVAGIGIGMFLVGRRRRGGATSGTDERAAEAVPGAGAAEGPPVPPTGGPRDAAPRPTEPPSGQTG